MVGVILKPLFPQWAGHDVQVIHLIAIRRAAGMVAFRYQDQMIQGERAMLRFRRMRTLQKIASVHASVNNHFPTERHLQNRDH